MWRWLIFKEMPNRYAEFGFLIFTVLFELNYESCDF